MDVNSIDHVLATFIELMNQNLTPGVASSSSSHVFLSFLVKACLNNMDLEDHLKWDPSREVEYVYVRESIEWLSYPLKQVISKESLESLKTISDELPKDVFCSSSLVCTLTECKRKLFNGHFPDAVIQKARFSSNPFELIGKGIFLNRSAIKMSNIDAAFDSMFTGDTNCDVLYFGDVCAGPGGFSEYILWRCNLINRKVKGFGITLKGDLDFQTDKLNTESFDIHYGSDGDGNIYSTANLKSFRDHVLTNTIGKGADFVMADGSFFIEGEQQHVDQEILHSRLYLCQFIAGLSVLKTGGHFVCKLFDTLTAFTISLVYLMYRCFDSVCLFKPNSSRPASSEKYVVCKSKKDNTDEVLQFVMKENSCWDDQTPVKSLVPIKLIIEDENFIRHVQKCNTYSIRRQIFFLDKMYAFALHPSLKESRQHGLKKSCLQRWNIPFNNKNHLVKRRFGNKRKGI